MSYYPDQTLNELEEMAASFCNVCGLTQEDCTCEDSTYSTVDCVVCPVCVRLIPAEYWPTHHSDCTGGKPNYDHYD